MKVIRAEDIFSPEHSIVKELFEENASLFDVIKKIKELCIEKMKILGEEYEEIAPLVFTAKDAQISDKATVRGPTIIGSKTEIRPGAYIRGGVIIGDGAVIGNSTEIKNSIIFDGVQLPHYNYVGDSIIGYRAHLGAGAIISNFRLDRKSVTVKTDTGKINTELRKLGAFVGDLCEIGCNSVICPGSILGRGTMVYPLSCINGITNLTTKAEEREEAEI